MQAKWLRALKVVVGLIVLAFVIGWVLQHTTEAINDGKNRAGFGRGVIHGALMPLALPNLLIGRDVPIYAINNTGVPYKLGYTAGVNACGALFFGLIFWRWSRRGGRAPAGPKLPGEGGSPPA